LQPNGVLLPPNEHNTDESTRQARITLDSRTEGTGIMCSSSAREDAGPSSCSHRKEYEPSLMGLYLFQFLSVPLFPTIMVQFCSQNTTHKVLLCIVIQLEPTRQQSSMPLGNLITMKLLVNHIRLSNSHKKTTSCIIQHKFFENQETQLTWRDLTRIVLTRL
jgi:hypothetical protein